MSCAFCRSTSPNVVWFEAAVIGEQTPVGRMVVSDAPGLLS